MLLPGASPLPHTLGNGGRHKGGSPQRLASGPTAPKAAVPTASTLPGFSCRTLRNTAVHDQIRTRLLVMADEAIHFNALSILSWFAKLHQNVPIWFLPFPTFRTFTFRIGMPIWMVALEVQRTALPLWKPLASLGKHQTEDRVGCSAGFLEGPEPPGTPTAG